MKKLYLLLGVVFLSACETLVPVYQPFPTAPKELLTPAKTPVPIPLTDNLLTEFLSSVIDNNTTCGENYVRLTAWQTWYNQQKKLYDAKLTGEETRSTTPSVRTEFVIK